MNADRTLIAVPTYNERENVAELVPRLLQAEARADVMLIDDDSPDGTATFAEDLFAADTRFSVMRRRGGRSYAQSIVAGYGHALERGYARLVHLDADFSHDPRSIPALVAASADADVVIGSRYCLKGRVANWSLHRRLLSKFANGYVSLIAGVRVSDATSGFRCYTRRALYELRQGLFTAEGYAFLVETIFHAERAGLRIAELPITFVDRREGQSKMSRSVIIESALVPWRLRFNRQHGNSALDEGS